MIYGIYNNVDYNLIGISINNFIKFNNDFELHIALCEVVMWSSKSTQFHYLINKHSNVYLEKQLILSGAPYI